MESSVAVSLVLAGITGLLVGCSGNAPSAPSTQELAHPETVAIDFFSSARQSAACSGTLLAPNVVLTSASCATGAGGARVVAPHAHYQSSTVAFALTYDWQDADPTSAHDQENDLALLVLRGSIALSKYPVLEKTSCEGCNVIAVTRTGSTASKASLQTSKVMRVATGTPAGHPTALFVAQPSGGGGAVFHVDAKGGTSLTGVMIGKGEKTGGGYIARLSDPNVQAWISGVMVAARKHPIASGATSARSLHALDDGTDPGAGSDPNAGTDPSAGADPNAGSDPNAGAGANPGTDPNAAGTDPNGDPTAPPVPSTDEPVNLAGATPSGDTPSDTAPQTYDVASQNDVWRCYQNATGRGLSGARCGELA